MPQRVAITGASGLIGGALSAFLRERGDEVVHLVRRPARHPGRGPAGTPPAGASTRRPSPASTAVVHLAGAGVGDQRWTPRLPAADPRLPRRRHAPPSPPPWRQRGGQPVRLVSGVGRRASTATAATRSSPRSPPPATGFLSEVVRAWEAAADPAREAGLPVATTRTGLVFAPDGGALARMLPLGQARHQRPARQRAPVVALDLVARHGRRPRPPRGPPRDRGSGQPRRAAPRPPARHRA